MPKKNWFSQSNGVENGSNISQSVPDININYQKHILGLYKWRKDDFEKSSSNPLLKKFPYKNIQNM